MEKCISTCYEKRTLEDCNITYWTTWSLLKKQTVQPMDKSVKEKEICARKISTLKEKMIEECIDDCKPTCFEQTYEVAITKGDESNNLVFKFKMEMHELVVTETEKYEILVLLSNFGGTLGLLAGVSALSFIELLVWFLLFVVEGISHISTRGR